MKTKSVASSALTVVACVLCVTLVMRPTIVSGASMMPTLHDKDVLITSPLAKDYFVAGDNRGNSLDSRIFGLISKSQIHAKVLAQIRLTWAP